MGFMLVCPRKRSLVNDNMAEKPSKKIKLGFQNDGSAGNDDLWGQDDEITAEEFDLLEVQATQSCYQNNSLLNNSLLTNNLPPKACTSVEKCDLKQQQYELEGRIKLLSLSLDKTTKELNEERLNREMLINEKMKQSHEREVSLKKEVDRLQSILEFKEQEMKSTYSKLQMLKSQVKNKKDIDSNKAVNSNCEDFLKSSKCDEQFVRHDKKRSEKDQRKYKLSVDTPRGELNGMEIISSLLCTRLTVPSYIHKENTTNFGCSVDSSFNFSLNPLSVLHLKNEQKCDEILEYYCNFMKTHVNILKILTSKNNQMTTSKNSPVSTKPKEAFCSQTVVCYLKDITYIYSSSSLKFNFQKSNTANQNPSASMHLLKNERESFLCIQQNERASMYDSTLSLIQSLLALSNPETYPIGYHKNEEMECALSSLLSICLSFPNDFLDLVQELPCYFLSNPHQSVTGLCTTLKLLIALCPNKKFIFYLAHKDSQCIFCLIAAFLHITVPASPEKFVECLILVEDFLSSTLLIHNYKETQLGTFSCISEVIQGMIKSLWKYFQIREDNVLSLKILRKGFLFLHFISSNIPNFKESRIPVEDEYISLVSGILAVSKENIELKEFYDLIHNLWDFQTDISEFYLDELSEETQGCANDTDVNNIVN